jgi:CubicO group peptidase (beta-lactamase class C family)
MLASHGELDGVRILSSEQVDVIRTLQTDARDEVLGYRVRKALGYFLGGDVSRGGIIPMGTSGNEFGHTGAGGSLGFADPGRRIGFGLTKNLMTHGLDKTSIASELRETSLGGWNAAFLTAEAIRNQIDSPD